MTRKTILKFGAVEHAEAGDLPGFEEASRALFAGDEAGFAGRLRQWPADVGDYLASLSVQGAG